MYTITMCIAIMIGQKEKKCHHISQCTLSKLQPINPMVILSYLKTTVFPYEMWFFSACQGGTSTGFDMLYFIFGLVFLGWLGAAPLSVWCRPRLDTWETMCRGGVVCMIGTDAVPSRIRSTRSTVSFVQNYLFTVTFLCQRDDTRIMMTYNVSVWSR